MSETPFIQRAGQTPPPTDDGYTTTGATDFTAEGTIFEVADDTRYQLLNPWMDLTPFTAADVVTIQLYRSVSAAGGTYRKAGAPITYTVGTDNPIVEMSNIAHIGYVKVVATSVPARTVDVPFGYIKQPLE